MKHVPPCRRAISPKGSPQKLSSDAQGLKRLSVALLAIALISAIGCGGESNVGDGGAGIDGSQGTDGGVDVDAGERPDSSLGRNDAALADAATADGGPLLPDAGPDAGPPPTRLLTHMSVDELCDGTENSCSENLRSPTGQLLESRNTDCATGEPSRFCRFFEYDGMDRRVLGEDDGDCDGTPDSNCRTWSFNDDTNTRQFDRDMDCDGSTDRSNCTQLEYDAEGRITLSQRCEEPDAPCTRYVYDEGGRLTSRGVDLDCDESADSNCLAWTYNSEGNLLSSHTDNDCDGTPDRICRVQAYDIQGRLTTSTLDADCDPDTPNNCSRFEYNEMGRISTSFADRGCDGVVSSCTSFTYEELPIP